MAKCWNIKGGHYCIVDHGFNNLTIAFRLCEMCRAKQEELNSVLRAITEMGSDGRLRHSTGDDVGSRTTSTCVGNVGDCVGHCPHVLTCRLLQARVDTMDKEVGFSADQQYSV
jgi:hypothetical protein